MVMQQIQLFAAHIIAKRMLKRPPKPVFILLAQREGFVAVYRVRIAGILHAGHARRNHHHFAELVLNDVGIVERDVPSSVGGNASFINPILSFSVLTASFCLGYIYFYDTTLHQKTQIFL